MFIEMTGKTLSDMMNEDEMGASNLSDVGVTDDSIVRVNKQGDIELRSKPAALAVAYLLTVDPDVESGIHPLEP